MENDLKDLMVVFGIARRELANEREQVKHLILLEERLLEVLGKIVEEKEQIK